MSRSSCPAVVGLLGQRSRNGRFISLQFKGSFTRLQLRRRHNVEAYNQSTQHREETSCLFTFSGLTGGNIDKLERAT